MRGQTMLIIFIVLAFELPQVFCFTREQDEPIMQYLQKRAWSPVLSFEAQLHCKRRGHSFLNDLRHYGCFCGVTAEMRKYTNPSSVDPMDDLDRCCKTHNKCLKDAISRTSGTYCSNKSIKKCETQLIDCIDKKVKFNDLKEEYKNFDRRECK